MFALFFFVFKTIKITTKARTYHNFFKLALLKRFANNPHDNLDDNVADDENHQRVDEAKNSPLKKDNKATTQRTSQPPFPFFSRHVRVYVYLKHQHRTIDS